MTGLQQFAAQYLTNESGELLTAEDLARLRLTAGATMAKFTPVYADGFGDVKPSRANIIGTAVCIGLINEASTLNEKTGVTTGGPAVGTVPEWTAITGGALSTGEEYVVDPNNAGKLITATQFMALTLGTSWRFTRVGRASSSTVLVVAVQAPVAVSI